jgi:hypothetical protein
MGAQLPDRRARRELLDENPTQDHHPPLHAHKYRCCFPTVSADSSGAQGLSSVRPQVSVPGSQALLTTAQRRRLPKGRARQFKCRRCPVAVQNFETFRSFLVMFEFGEWRVKHNSHCYANKQMPACLLAHLLIHNCAVLNACVHIVGVENVEVYTVKKD